MIGENTTPSYGVVRAEYLLQRKPCILRMINL